MTSETESDQDDSDTLDIETRKCPTETGIVTLIKTGTVAGIGRKIGSESEM